MTPVLDFKPWQPMFERALEDMSCALTLAQQSTCLSYLGLLHHWNQAYNLTAIRDPEQMLIAHMLDSLAILPWVTGKRVLDVGSGGGLPGLPVAIAKPTCQVTLLDSNGKKTRFLKQAAYELALTHVTVVQSRIEKFYAASPIDVMMVRAVGPLETLFAQTRHLHHPGLRLLYLTGQAPADVRLASAAVTVVPLSIPHQAGQRHLICVDIK